MAFPPWTHGCGQAAPGTHGAGRDLGNVDLAGGLWGCGWAGATSRLALWQEGQSRSAGPQHTCPCVSRVPPQIGLFVGARWQMGSYTTVDTPSPADQPD